MSSQSLERLSAEELLAECGVFLPSKEVLSVPLLDLNADINLALDLAAPIDLAVAGNANIVLPVNASVSANALSALSVAEAGGSQGVALDQFISGHAVAHGYQTSDIDQTGSGAAAGTGASLGVIGTPTDHPDATVGHATPPNAVSQPVPVSAQPPVTEATQPATDATHPAAEAAQPSTAATQPAAETAQPSMAATQPAAETAQPPAEAAAPQPPTSVEPTATDAAQPAVSQPAAAVTAPEPSASLDGGLLNVNVNVDLDSKLAAPITGAVALNANVAAPINGSVSANVGTIGSQAVAVADQTAIISQQLQDVTAEAVTHQDSHIHQ